MTTNAPTDAEPTDAEPTGEVLIRAVALSRAFGGVKAVTDVDLEVREGEVLGIMGPNGAGKSTFLGLLAGAIRPSSGELHVLGRDMNRAARSDAARLGVGLAHQVPKPFRTLTVRQNVEVAAQVVPRTRRAQVVREALELTGVAGKADVLAGRLGLLELKRLELARALALDPRIVLLDEVAAGLTGADLDELIALVAQIHRTGRTIVVVEHVQEVLHSLATRVVVLEWGQKLMEGTPAEVSADPRVVEIYLGTSHEREQPRGRRGPSEEPPVLQVEGLGAGYGPIRVLDDVSFSLAPGRVLAVLGANGAGKSTLAKTIQGSVAARAGAIRFDGRDITRTSPHLRLREGLALVPEGRRLFGAMTVRENLDLGLRSSRRTEPLERVHELFPRLVELADRPAGALSGGEQQMVAIGRALASEPKVVVFDELSLGLAPVIVERMLDAVETIAGWGTAVVLIEQNTAQALELADAVLVLRRGRTIYSGPREGFDESDLHRAYLGVDHDDDAGAAASSPTAPPCYRQRS